ncbi:MAG: FAD-dependent oxidoreductase [Cyanomargarita calcarea GSE-NOS-MK-12-04C]|jgi:hypothetical protein|uniref:FAD-dependent oxidoreductase n=1 Tax=Cyanomargarita calcarea GSE-NOS-MK-12-04C TaxID=2839659 RepID=A0A951UTL1_9CYAN|nr:FAD-dependent oxidoreductase [Cyanomargarita calcarea GSE-NOS-MK-12-04C]
MVDIAVIGAGMAGLVCAQQLTQAGYSVIVVDKSRGLGGRVATRRLHETYADHGACYLKSHNELLRRFVELLCDRHILEVWTTPRYIAPEGMNAIAKFLGRGLEFLLNHRVETITPTPENQWRLTFESSNEKLTAASVVMAIPAPQALMLLEPLGETVLGEAFLGKLRSVQFDPTLTVIAGYPPDSKPLPEWKALNFADDAVLGWIGLDSSKRPNPQQPVFVVHSSADFAQLHDQTQDLHPIGKQILQHSAQSLEIPWLDTPDWTQVHRWRYAFPRTPLAETFLAASTELPLVCCGDWCGGNLIEGAMLSGLAAASKINTQLQSRILPGNSFLDFLA